MQTTIIEKKFKEIDERLKKLENEPEFDVDFFKNTKEHEQILSFADFFRSHAKKTVSAGELRATNIVTMRNFRKFIDKNLCMINKELVKDGISVKEYKSCDGNKRIFMIRKGK